MISASDTAYPLLKAHPSARELEEIFTPTLFELTFAEQRAREPIPTVGLLVRLKTFQRLGYFVKIAEIPNAIIRCIAKAAGYLDIPEGLSKYDDRPVRFRHMEEKTRKGNPCTPSFYRSTKSGYCERRGMREWRLQCLGANR